MRIQSRPRPEDLAQHLIGRLEILFAVLYGSAVDSEIFRDLDVGIMVDRARVPADSSLDYAFELSARLEKSLHFPVDVRVLNDAPLPFRYNVSRGIPLAPIATGCDHALCPKAKPRCMTGIIAAKPVL